MQPQWQSLFPSLCTHLVAESNKRSLFLVLFAVAVGKNVLLATPRSRTLNGMNGTHIRGRSSKCSKAFTVTDVVKSSQVKPNVMPEGYHFRRLGFARLWKSHCTTRLIHRWRGNNTMYEAGQQRYTSVESADPIKSTGWPNQTME